ncbi:MULTISPECIES: VOC family protein [Xanthobacteraceae]|uniref:Catechol 2,3-dioxygenase-like lactoylglutathione lyase family enzyme n=1 Tax=Labrys monachus TaxID=217067 RepID=A0ABU0FG61_9HYPH|nr:MULTISPECIES: VOC family protein [Xanthobacteraceae]MBS7538196.1 VOC family protein [Ancylobacter lacus]MDQ0393516.1 catechol 2,3-dioxygenase-like lactoylglutathione lyase family enzyme [Labrys monachus]
MFAYAMLGTNDLDRAIRFYDPLMERLGQPRCWTGDNSVSWGSLEDYAIPGLCVGRPFDSMAATSGNGVMLALRAPSVAQVKDLYELAMTHGGSDEGLPGPRPQYGPGFYAAYVRDPDGNKLAFVCYQAEVGEWTDEPS